MSRKSATYAFSADEYERMGEAGILAPGARLELIEGEIYEMLPIGSPHAACVKYLSRLLNRQFSDSLIVSTQNPIRLDDYSEPQPDVAVVRWRDDFYRHAHPTPADVLLVIEVADSTVETDRTVKMPLYARANIPEAWLVNLPDSRVEIYSAPSNGSYQTANHFTHGEEAQSVTMPQLSINVAELMG